VKVDKAEIIPFIVHQLFGVLQMKYYCLCIKPLESQGVAKWTHSLERAMNTTQIL